MTPYRILALVVAAFFALGITACGSDKKSVPTNSVAVVGDKAITKAQFDQLIQQARKSYGQQKRKFPQPGTAEYNALRGQAMQFLVQRTQFEQKAAELDVEVSDADVDKRLTQLKKQYFKGNEKKYRDQLAKQGLTEEQVKADVRAQLIQEKVYQEVTKDVEVSDAEIKSHYEKNKAQYVQPATRQIRHILVKKKDLADSIYDQLQNGANFAALAKKYSQDPSSKAQGGRLTISRGQTVPAFDKRAFELFPQQLSTPVKTQYGWHVIQALGPVKETKTTPLKQVKEAIRQQLLQEKKQKKMTAWVESMRKDFAKKTTYQVGYAPPETGTQKTQQ